MTIGIRLSPADLRMGATVHRNPTSLARVGLVFEAPYAPERHPAPVNAEPHKWLRISCYAGAQLPAATYLYTAACVVAYRNGVPLVLSGWS